MPKSRESQKAKYELRVLLDFLDRCESSIDRNSIRKGNPDVNEPDFIMTNDAGQSLGIELGRLVDPNLAKELARWEPRNGVHIRTTDPTPTIARKKIEATYNIEFPVELLLYVEYPIITPDDVIIPTLKPICDIDHQYAKIWFMGDSIELLY